MSERLTDETRDLLRLQATKAIRRESRTVVVNPDNLLALLDDGERLELLTSQEELDAQPSGAILLLQFYSVPVIVLKTADNEWAAAGHPGPFTTARIHKAMHGEPAQVIARLEATS